MCLVRGDGSSTIALWVETHEMYEQKMLLWIEYYSSKKQPLHDTPVCKVWQLFKTIYQHRMTHTSPRIKKWVGRIIFTHSEGLKRVRSIVRVLFYGADHSIAMVKNWKELCEWEKATKNTKYVHMLARSRWIT